MAELAAAISLFTDLGTGQPQERAVRSTVVAMRLADQLALDDAARVTVYYATLLRFLGCVADTHQEACSAAATNCACSRRWLRQ
jgi:hypothetical protein